MPTYKVIKFFTDLQDNDYPYDVGDFFPRQGLIVSAERFAELAGRTNRQGVPLIKQVAIASEINEAVTATPTAKKSGKKTKKAAEK